jgi:integrase
LGAAGIRGRVIISFVAFSAVRPEVLGTQRADDGLRLGDLPDLEIDGRSVRIRRTPAQITVRRSLSKVARKYVTFLPAEGCKYLLEYLENRLGRGEELRPDSPVVRPDYSYETRGRPEGMRGSNFLGRQGVSQEIREALRGQGLAVRPYVLRAYAASALLSAQREGKITDIDREFFLGRKGAITSVYTVHKDLPAAKIDEMRKQFAACEPYLGAKPQAAEVPATDLREIRAMVDWMRGFRESVESGVSNLARDPAKLLEFLENNPKFAQKFSSILSTAAK